MDESFKQYVNQNPEKKCNTSTQQKPNAFEAQQANVDPKKEKELRETAKRYEGKSEDELMGEILRQASLGKKTGKLSQQDIDNFYQNVYPMLSRDQRRKLDSIIKKIK